MNHVNSHQLAIARARRAKRRREGMTLIEIMIVVGIIAMIAGGVAVALLPNLQKAKIKTTMTDAQALRSAVILYLSDNGKGCPTVNDLTEGRYLDSSKRTVDAWNNEFTIGCDDGDVLVSSAGPDGQAGTDDDIQ